MHHKNQFASRKPRKFSIPASNNNSENPLSQPNPSPLSNRSSIESHLYRIMPHATASRKMHQLMRAGVARLPSGRSLANFADGYYPHISLSLSVQPHPPAVCRERDARVCFCQYVQRSTCNSALPPCLHCHTISSDDVYELFEYLRSY